MLKKSLTAVIAVIAVVGATGLGVCSPSYFGYTGLIVVPSADVLPAGGWDAGAYAKLHDLSDTNQYFVNLGAVENLEIGLLRSKTGGNAAAGETTINLKYAMPRLEDQDLRLAMGIIDATAEGNTWVYAVASKNLIHRRTVESEADPKTLKALEHFRDIDLDGHFGIIGGPNSNFFVGLEAKFGRYVSVLGEHFNNSKNFGVRAHLSDRLSADFGIVHMGNTAHRVGVSYTEAF